MAESMELSTFERYVGDRFRLEFADGPAIELTLVEAGAGPWQRPEGDEGRAPFRLEFTGPPDPVLAQQTHNVTHEALGAFDIFFGPIARTSEATTYEAIFS